MGEILQKDEELIAEIVSCARGLFEKFGLKKTTMEDIAREVGKGKSTLYYYFPSKYEIFESVVDQEINELFKMACRAMDNVDSAVEKLKAFSRVRVKKIQSAGNLFQVIKNDLYDNMDVVMKIKRKHEVAQVQMLTGIISGGVETGEFRQMTKPEIQMMANVLAALFKGMSLPLCPSGSSYDLSHHVDDIITMLIDGIRAH